MDATGEKNRNLVTFLIQDRRILHEVVGTSMVFDDSGFKMLTDAIRDYRERCPAKSRPKGRRQPQPA